MTLKFYFAKVSPSVRAVHITLKVLNVSHEIVNIDLAKKEHKSEEYLKINPQGTVPCIEDDGFVVIDSHAINAYLVTKYAKDDKLYPKDLKARANVDHKLHFDTGVLSATLKYTISKVLHTKAVNKVTPEFEVGFENTYATLEKLLGNNKYAAGDEITIADFSIIASLSVMDVLVPAKKEKFPKIVAYMERFKANCAPGAELIEEGINLLRNHLKTINFQLSA